MHGEYTVLMSMALDGEATPAQMARLQEHLRTCGACAEAWRRWRVLDRQLSSAPAVAPPVGLVEGVMARLAERELARRRARWLRLGLALGWVGLSLVLGLLAALAIRWGALHTRELAAAAALAVQLFEGVSWLARAAVARLGALDVSVAAGALGALASITCGLGILWFRMISRSSHATQLAAPRTW